MNMTTEELEQRRQLALTALRNARSKAVGIMNVANLAPRAAWTMNMVAAALHDGIAEAIDALEGRDIRSDKQGGMFIVRDGMRHDIETPGQE